MTDQRDRRAGTYGLSTLMAPAPTLNGRVLRHPTTANSERQLGDAANRAHYRC